MAVLFDQRSRSPRRHGVARTTLIANAVAAFVFAAVGAVTPARAEQAQQPRVSLDARDSATPGAKQPFEVVLPTARKAAPVVLLIHGWTFTPEMYTGLTNDLVERGYAVALFRAPDSREMNPDRWVEHAQHTLDAVVAAAAEGGPLAGKVDAAQVAVIGHSLGGSAALGVGARDERVKAVIALAPGTAYVPYFYNGFREKFLDYARGAHVPTLVIGAGNDDKVPNELFGKLVPGLCKPGACHYVEIAQVDHRFVADVAEEGGSSSSRRSVEQATMPKEAQMRAVLDAAGTWLASTMSTTQSAIDRAPGTRHASRPRTEHAKAAASSVKERPHFASERAAERPNVQKNVSPRAAALHPSSGRPIAAAAERAGRVSASHARR